MIFPRIVTVAITGKAGADIAASNLNFKFRAGQILALLRNFKLNRNRDLNSS